MLRDILRGTGVALITPFKEDKSIDFDALGAGLYNDSAANKLSLGTINR